MRDRGKYEPLEGHSFKYFSVYEVTKKVVQTFTKKHPHIEWCDHDVCNAFVGLIEEIISGTGDIYALMHFGGMRDIELSGLSIDSIISFILIKSIPNIKVAVIDSGFMGIQNNVLHMLRQSEIKFTHGELGSIKLLNDSMFYDMALLPYKQSDYVDVWKDTKFDFTIVRAGGELGSSLLRCIKSNGTKMVMTGHSRITRQKRKYEEHYARLVPDITQQCEHRLAKSLYIFPFNKVTDEKCDPRLLDYEHDYDYYEEQM
jgi:hypothetical protein